MVAVGDGVLLGDDKMAEASCSAVMSWNWSSDWAVGASVRSFVSVVRPWRMRYSGVTIGVVIVWWKNSTVLEILSALVSCGMICWHQ